MKKLITLFLILFPITVFAKTGYENILTFNSNGWSSQKTPSGLGLSCTLCENQVMVSIDVVPVNSSNKYAKNNADFISYLLQDKELLAKQLASESAMGGKVNILKADKAKIDNKDVFRYMFLVDGFGSKTFDNTSMLVHKGHIVKVTLNYFDGHFSKKDKIQVNSFYNSLKFTP